jgi:hypothetical protein
MYHDPPRRGGIVEQALHCFITDLLNDGGSASWGAGGAQALSDLAFLQKLASLRGGEWNKTCESLASKANQVQKMVSYIDFPLRSNL